MRQAALCVSQFNEFVLGIPRRDVGLMASEESQITVKSLLEEVDEFEEAHHAGDIIGCIDALMDNIYFALGALYKMGLNEEDIDFIFMTIHHANMAKKLGINDRRATGAADAVKPDGWISPEARIADYLDTIRR